MIFISWKLALCKKLMSLKIVSHGIVHAVLTLHITLFIVHDLTAYLAYVLLIDPVCAFPTETSKGGISCPRREVCAGPDDMPFTPP